MNPFRQFRRIGPKINMNTLNEGQLSEIEGGNVLLFGWAIVAYRDTLNKIEQNPQDYAWMMDWYYQR